MYRPEEMERTEPPPSTAQWVDSHTKLYRSAHVALLHFLYMDRANAKVHDSHVRYSPLTFRLAEALSACGWVSDAIAEVMGHRGQYEEDKGR